MADNTRKPVDGPGRSVCIHTMQIVDSCLDKDCVEDLRVYLTESSQETLDNSTGAKTRCAELLYSAIEVEALSYKSGHYAVDITFYYRILGDALFGGTRPTTITGLAVFAKRVVLYGGKSCAKIYRSTDTPPVLPELAAGSKPVAVVEALDPMVLSAKVRELGDGSKEDTLLTNIPSFISDSFGEQLVLTGDSRRLYVTIGQFSTVRLERETQLTIPVCEYCAPTRECCDEECCEEDPCDLFSRIAFPMQAFFPESGASGNCDGSCSCCTGK